MPQAKHKAMSSEKTGRDDPAAIKVRTPCTQAKDGISIVVAESVGLVSRHGRDLRPESEANLIPAHTARASVVRADDPEFAAEANIVFRRAATFALAVLDRVERIFGSALDSDIDGQGKDPRSARLGEAKIAKVCIDSATIALRTYCLARGIALDAASQSASSGKTTFNINGPCMIGGTNAGQDPQSAEIARLLATLPPEDRARWQAAISHPTASPPVDARPVDPGIKVDPNAD